ncbi:hypothetical protein, partial [Metaclostridioides mangenotii]|uniref:P-type ATPase n=1 Tax=Metaclostridioides mangenotii TaxID=1540 RepID=UPI002ED53DBF
VTYGRGIGVVTETGMDTEVGNIAELLENQDDFDTPLKRKLNSIKAEVNLYIVLITYLFSE